MRFRILYQFRAPRGGPTQTRTGGSMTLKRVKSRGAPRSAPPPPDGLQSVQTAFRILDALSNAHGPVGLSSLAAEVGELKPRVYRHLATLKRLGVVFQDARNGG